MSDVVGADRRPDAADLLRCSPDGIVSLSLDGYILEANEAFSRLTGYSHDELLGTRHDRVTAPEHHDTETRISRAVAETGIAAGYEKDYVRKNGERVPAW